MDEQRLIDCFHCMGNVSTDFTISAIVSKIYSNQFEYLKFLIKFGPFTILVSLANRLIIA